MAHPSIESTRLVIGMEIHVELATRSKMFSRTANVAHPDFHDAAPNTVVDPVVAALPGALPVINRAAVEMSMLVGLALDCSIASRTRWDRKNYFYPDLPKGYQISQYDLPLCLDGQLEIPVGDTTRQVQIIRAHLEEDTGKLGHDLPGGEPYEGSLVDLDRAGTPLLEIVTQPDLRSADEAVTFCRELRAICRFLGVTEGDMQRGHMRFEPNINVLIETGDGREFATPVVEVKNLNSFRAVRDAITFEHDRQVRQWSQDGLVQGPGMKRTRGWNDERGETVLQREKEDAHDYRYFPDPDLPPVVISDEWKQAVAARVPELPIARRRRYVADYHLSEAEAQQLAEDRPVCEFFEACVEAVFEGKGTRIPAAMAGDQAAKWLLNAGAQRANERGVALAALGITPAQLADLIALRRDDTIGSSAADTLFALLCESDTDAMTLAEQHGLIQVSDTSALDAWIEQAIAQQQQAADDFAAGKDAAAGRLVGQVMKLSQGQADAKAVQERLVTRLRATGESK